MDFFGTLPPIETIVDKAEYGKRLVQCSKSASYFAEQFMGLEVFDYNKVFLDCEERFIVLRTGRQCLEENEYVYLSNGIKKVKDLINNEEILGGKAIEPIIQSDDIYEIIFWNGIKIKCNKEHPFYTNKGWVELSKLKSNDIVQFNNSSINGTFSIGKNKAKLFGYLYSDGYFSNGQSAKFTNNNKEFIDEVIKLCTKEFDVIPNIRSKNKGFDVHFVGKMGRSTRYNQNELIKFIRENDLMNENFGNIQNLPNEELKEFIKGYFNGDGYLWCKERETRSARIEIGFAIGKNKDRAYQFQYMLWKLGINSIVKEEWMKKSTRPFYRVLISRHEEINKIIDILDHNKYPHKFNKAKSLINLKPRNKNPNFIIKENNFEWVKIRSIKKIGKGNIVNFEVTPSEEIISYCGARTHNCGKSTNSAIKAIHFGYFAPLKAGNLFEGIANVVIASVTKPQAFLIFEKISNFIHRSPTLSGKILNETKTELSLKWFNNKGYTKFIVRAIGDTGVSLRGYTTHMAILDEAAYIPQVVFDSFLPSTVTTKPKIIFASTPKLKAGAFFNACENSYVLYRKGIPQSCFDSKGNEKSKNEKYRWVQFHVKTRDSPLAASDPEILALISETSKGAEAQELDGEFPEGGNSLIAYNILQESIVQAPTQKYEYYDLGVDTSGKGKDETVLTVVGITESGLVFPVHYYTEITTDQIELAKTIDGLDKLYHFRRIYLDSTGIGDTLVDACAHQNSYLPLYPINFRELKTELYTNLQRLFEYRMINLSLIEEYHRSKLMEQIQAQYWEYGKDRDSPQKIRTFAPHDDYPDSLALACFGQEKVEDFTVIPDEFLNS